VQRQKVLVAGHDHFGRRGGRAAEDMIVVWIARSLNGDGRVELEYVNYPIRARNREPPEDVGTPLRAS